MHDPIDVAFVLPGLARAGGVRAVLEIADRLRASGRSTVVVVPERALLSPRRSLSGILQRVAPAAVQPLVQRLSPRRVIAQDWFALQTPLVVAAGVPLWRDIPLARAVVATTWRTAEEVLRNGAVARRGVYLLQHYETWSGPARRVDATWRRSDRLVVSSAWLRDIALGRFSKPASAVTVAPYGVDRSVFTPAVDRAAGSPPVVGLMHDDRRWKGGADLLGALEEVRREKEVRIRAFGMGRRPLPSWVGFEGPLTGERLAGFYRSLDLFVSASWTETGPMTLPEAMACEVAVVSTDVGNARLWGQDGAAVRLVPPREVALLADAIGSLLDDGVERERLARAGADAISGYTWDRMAGTFDEALVGWGLLEPLR